MQRRSFSLLPLLAVGWVWIVSGCRPEQPVRTEGSAQFVGTFEQPQATREVTRVSVALSAPDLDASRSLSLEKVDGTWGGTMDGIPAGADRTFTAEAFGADGTKLYAGKATGVTITAGETELVAIALEPLSPTTQTPLPPEVVSASGSASPGHPSTLEVEAKDPQGSALGFAWSASLGTLGTPENGASASKVVWTAPACGSTGETLSVTVTVSNALGLSTSHVFTFGALPGCAPPPGTWAAIGGLARGSEAITATPLASGRVLVLDNAGAWRGLAEVYDPVTGLSIPTGFLKGAHTQHTATLLPSGKVLVAGGETASAELYDPATNTWSSTGSLSVSRSAHTATLLPSGQVLVVGGWSTGVGALGSAELYDPETGTWSPVASLSVSHQGHTATLLPSGKVLVAGGDSTVAELYDPATGTWTPTGPLGSNRTSHAAALLPSGKVLVVGGVTGGDVLATAELYDPATGTWSPTGEMARPRNHASVAVLPSGKVLVAGGSSDQAELYDPATGRWSATTGLAKNRERNTLVALPSGKVVLLGGSKEFLFAEVYDPAAETWAAPGRAAHRAAHTLTVLPSGRVLAAGGFAKWGAGVGLDSVELYDPGTRSWSATGRMLQARYWHTATVLPSGKVLVTGGETTETLYVQTAEVYDPAVGTWSAAAPMNVPRADHTATLLPSGRVLVVGSAMAGATTEHEAELYDPATGSWSPARAPSARHASGHTATLLPSGKVLVVGGRGEGGSMFGRVAELYDPVTDTWTPTGSTAIARWRHTATLLPSGKVLVVGGSTPEAIAAELYDPESGTWSTVGSLRHARFGHTATLLPSGKVLVVGGEPEDGMTLVELRADLYDPDTGTWSAVADTPSLLSRHKAVLLPSGQVLVVGTAYEPYAPALLYTP